jgi:sugar/nucleoside kinase (ribokinase family)
MDVVGVGSLNVDLFYEVPSLNVGGKRFEPGAEVFGNEEEFSQVVAGLSGSGKLVGRSGGGSAANTAFALARMGYSAGFLGVAGKDDHGKFVLGSMAGVDISHVKKYRKTGMCISMLTRQDRSLLVLPNSNDLFSFTEEDIEYLNSSKIVHLSSFVSANALNMQKRMLDQLDERIYVSFAPGELYARRGLGQLAEVLSRSRLLFVSEREVEMLTGRGPSEGSGALLDTGPHVVACTMGEKGSLITTRTVQIPVPAKRTVVVDKTGAGDVYAAGFLAGYLDGASLEVCGQIASAAAALSIASYGRMGYPDERFLRKYATELG